MGDDARLREVGSWNFNSIFSLYCLLNL